MYKYMYKYLVWLFGVCGYVCVFKENNTAQTYEVDSSPRGNLRLLIIMLLCPQQILVIYILLATFFNRQTLQISV